MLQNMKQYSLESATLSRNAYKEQVKSFSSIGTVEMFITFASITQNEQNNIALDEYSHIGLSADPRVIKGMRIGGKYIVQYVLESKPFNRIFLKEVV